MATSSQSKESYEVFLSFRGPQTRCTIISHLFKDLDRRGINTFKDDERLIHGESVLPALIKAIEKSRIAVIIFTPDFASSSSCLEEVAKIMECKETNKLIVLPVFYNVDPNEVREGRKEYKKALDDHETKKNKDDSLKDVKRWKQALKDAGSLYGSEFNVWVVAEEATLQLKSMQFKVEKNFRKGASIHTGGKFRTEADLVESIVREIWIQLDPKPFKVADFPVGINSRVNELISKFNMKSQEENLTLVLWSMGGMGKTTLAKALYNSIFKDFEVSAYVDNIKGTLKESEQMVRLQKNLLSQILMRRENSFSSDAEGSTSITDGLRDKRVLLILDGVDDSCQIDRLAGERNRYGKGSKFIITTANKLVLNDIAVSLHIVQPLEDTEALVLFKNRASVNGPKTIKEDLQRRVLQCTHGLPLALEVLGRAFAAGVEKDWEGILTKFAQSSDQGVNQVLSVSYDGLDPEDRRIFLHIACFFNGWSRRYVEGVLKNCALSVETTVNNLIQRSLITEENGTLKVHDLIEKMGKLIVDRECLGDAAKRSRLWRHEDVRDVLSGDEGTSAVEAIVLTPPNLEKIEICSESFAKLRNLRFLIMINVEADFRDPRPICLPRELSLPRKLRWFEWPECPASSLKLTSPDNLAVLAMRKHLFKEQEPEEP